MRGLWLRASGRWNPEIARTTPPNPPHQIPAPAESHPGLLGLGQRWDLVV